MISGCFSGVQKKIRSIVPQAIYIHCYAHRLNLCLVQTLKSVISINDFFETVQGIYKLLMNSQSRYELFVEICEVLSVLSSDGEENCRVMAVGYLQEISCPRFISILISIESILEIVYCTSNELQNCKLLLSSAIKLVNLTEKIY